jgi:hypothetical protein
MNARTGRSHKVAIGLGIGALVVVAAGGGKQLATFAMIGLFLAMVLGVVVLRAIWRAATRSVTGLDLLIAAFVWRHWHRRHYIPGPTWPEPYSGPTWHRPHYLPYTGPTAYPPPAGLTSYPPT